MPWRNFLLVVHIGGAIALFGPSFVYPVIMTRVQKGDDAKTLMRAMRALTKYLVNPADYVLPASGALLILQSKGAWDPFIKENRWLLGAIVLFTIMYLIAHLIALPTEKKALAAAEAGDTATFQALTAKIMKVGPVLGLLLTTIIVLMIVKPGSGFIHP